MAFSKARAGTAGFLAVGRTDGRYRVALENLSIGVAMVGLDGRWLYVNDAACRITGYSRDELLRCTFVDITHPDDRASSVASVQNVLAGRQPGYVLDQRYIRKDGATIWARINVALVRDAAGAPQMLVGAIQDITAQKRAEAQEASMRDVLERMAQGAPLLDVLAALVRAVERGATSGALGSIMLLDADGRRLHHGAAPSLPPAYTGALDGLEIGPAAGSCGTAACHNVCVRVSDIDRDALWDGLRPLARAYGLRACCSVPIASREGRVLGTLALYYREPRDPPVEDLRRLQLAAQTAAVAIERSRADEVRRASEEKFSTAFGRSPLGITITSLETGRLIDVNQGLLDVTGYVREELVGRTPEEVGLWIDPDERARRFAMFRAGQRPPDIEARFRAKDGRDVDALVASALIELDGRPCVLTSVVDITDRKRAERALRDSEAVQRFLVDLNAATQALTDPERIMAVTAERLGRHLDADRCAYAEVEADENAVTITGDYVRGVPSMVGRTQLAFFGPDVWRLLRENRTVVIDDVDGDARVPADPLVYRQTMIQAAIAVPLHKDGRLVAGMAVTHATPRRWRRDEVLLVELVVTRCWESIERARVVRRLAESEARARLALDVAGQGTWSWHPASGDLQADWRCREIAGMPAGALGLADAVARIHADDAPRVQAALARAVADGSDGAFAEEFRVVHADGIERWVLSRGQVRPDDSGGRPPTMLGTLLDISERKRIEQELTANDRRKDEFLAMLAHELRNPLAPLRNVVNVLRLSRGEDPLVRMMERQVDHMVRLVDDLLEVSRVSRGKIVLKPERTDLVALLRQILESHAPLVAAAGLTLLPRLPDAPVMSDADPVRLAQVFSNLLNNATKFTPAGGRVELDAHVEGGDAVVVVRDTGVGIPPDMLSRIFELFTQVDRTLHRAEGGLGIGLSLARSLVTLHGGRLEAHSDGPGAGSRFTVRLPLAAATVATGGSAARPPAPLGPVRQHRVLVVDDNRDAADSLGMLLSFLGAEVRIAHSGARALEAVERYRPTLVMLDLGMPGMDGFEVARRLRGRGMDVPLVALSGWGHDEDRRRTREAGFLHHLIKPADASAIQAVLLSVDARGAGSA